MSCFPVSVAGGLVVGMSHLALPIPEKTFFSLVNYGLGMRRRQALACDTVLFYEYPLHELNEPDVEKGKTPNHSPINKKQGLGVEELLQRRNIQRKEKHQKADQHASYKIWIGEYVVLPYIRLEILARENVQQRV